MKHVFLLTESDCKPWKEENLQGKFLVLKAEFFKEKFREAKYQLVLAQGGFGCNPESLGNAIYVTECHTSLAERYRIERCNNDILGIATEEAIIEWKKQYGEFNKEVLNALKSNHVDKN